MSVLFPAMLAGLLALAVPVLIHLIARHRYQVQDFPSLRLLRADERTNVFAWRLIDVGQLLLRLLVLLALVLAMARLFAPWPALGSAPRNLVVVVDASASMRMLSPNPATGQKTPLIELTKAKARELLADCRPPGLSALVAAGQDAQVLAALQPSTDAALRAADSIQAIDGTGSGLVPAIARACALVRGRREIRSQIVVLTDLRASAFEARTRRDLDQIAAARRDLGRSLDIVLVDAAQNVPDSGNLAVVEAHVRGGIVKVGDDAHVVARVVNFGERERSAKLRLTVGQRSPAASGRGEPVEPHREPFAKDITLGPNASAVVDLTTRVNRAARTFVQVQAEADDPMPHDNSFALPLHVADVRRVLIVQEPSTSSSSSSSSSSSILPPSGRADSTTRTTTSTNTTEEGGGIDGATILRFGLNPGRELGRSQGTGIATTVVAPEALPAQALSKYDAVFLYGVSALPESALKDLDTFVRQGRALVHIGSSGCNAMRFNRTFAAAGPDRGVLSPAELGNERVLDPPLGLADWGVRMSDRGLESVIGNPQSAIRNGLVHPLLEPFRDRLKGDLSVVRFARIREIRHLAPDASAIFATSNGMPLAIEMQAERGRIVLLAFGLEPDCTTLARARVFPALVWRLMDYLTGRLKATPSDVLTALCPAVLDVSEPGFAFAKGLDLVPAEAGEGKPESAKALAREGETCLVPGLPAGLYAIEKSQPSAAPAGKASAARFGYARLIAVNPDPRESDTARIADSDLAEVLGPGVRTVGIADAPGLSVRGSELWRALVLLLVLAYAAEGIIGWILSARREKERAGGK